jgi:long-chain acyl-CoA synthetase
MRRSLLSPVDILLRSARLRGERPALITSDRSFSHEELSATVDRVAGALGGLGVEPGQRVSLYSQNRWEWIVAYHGALRLGAVVNPLNVMLTPPEVAFAAQDCGASLVIGSPDRIAPLVEIRDQMPSVAELVSFDEPPAGALGFDALLEGAPAAPERELPAASELCSIGYTSGTTGHPKGAMQTHGAVALNCGLTATMHVRNAADVMLTALPAPHVYGNVAINGTLLAGGTVVLMDRFDPGLALALIAEHGVTLFEGVPTMYAAMLGCAEIERVDLSTLTRCTVGGQTMAVQTIAEWERRSGVPLLELWGMTEIAGLGSTHALYAPNVHGSIGVALPGIELRIGDLDDPAVTAPVGEPGELLVRGPIVMPGYYNNPQATAEAIDGDGWLHTGDIAYVNDTGHHFVVDRAKDMIITGGYNVYPAEIERVLAAHPAVSMVAVGAQQDELKGELARAYVVLRPGVSVTEAELIDFCHAELAAYKRPRSVSFVEDLPTTSTGKIMRRKLHTLDP